MKQVSIEVKVVGKETIARVVTDTYKASEEDIDAFCKGVVHYLKSEWANDEGEHSITVYPVTPKGKHITII
jgi:Holliday junction resolvase RusA-like endonuclease